MISIVTIPFLLIGVPSTWFFNWLVFPFYVGILLFLYASFMESSRGATIGKQVMNIKVTTVDGKLVGLDTALIRNLSKIHWFLWLMDTIVGMATPGDPHQKFMDRMVGTTVASTTASIMFAPTPPAPPAPSLPPPASCLR